jgi:hypothetical protein
MPKARYHYATIPAHHVIDGARLLTQPDAYLAEEPAFAVIRDLLLKGYRWIRTDTVAGESYAIFEKAVARTQP